MNFETHSPCEDLQILNDPRCNCNSCNLSSLPTMSCFRQTCKQKISGRRRRYRRALQIIQSEEYLEAADLDIIKRRHGTYFRNLDLRKKHRRPKRQVLITCISDQFQLVQKFNQGQLCVFPSIPRSNCSLSQLEHALVAGTAQDSCFQIVEIASPIVTTDNMALVPDVPLPSVASLAATVLALFSFSLLSSMMASNTVGNAPSGVAQPGSSNGGGLPNDFTNPTLGQSLALVPFGLTPIAVFPPFAIPRSLPAIGVIFSEKRQVPMKRRHRKKFRYSFGSRRRQEPLFGFNIEVTLIEDELCDFNSTCLTTDGNLPFQDYGFIRKQGNQFLTSGRPQCRFRNICK